MQPRIDRTRFGSVTIDGQVYEHDVLIRLGGKVEKRKKKAVQGHLRHLAHHLAGRGQACLPEGGRAAPCRCGQDGTVTLSKEAATYLERHRCQVQLLPTPEVIPLWNQADGTVIALVHVTC
jgi:hypothetical protein